jgi:hypothetical protein
MHFFLDLPATTLNATILSMVGSANQANRFDTTFVSKSTLYNGVTEGNHVFTVVTYEPTGNYKIERFTGLYSQTNIGLGFGDMDFSNSYTPTDIRCASGSGTCGNNSVEDILYNQNSKFSFQGAALDVNGDGLTDNRDLYLLGNELVARGAGQTVLNSYTSLLNFRGDQTGDGTTTVADMAALYDNFGHYSWQRDLHVVTDPATGLPLANGSAIDINDVKDMLTQILRTQPGDFNLDGSVDLADYTTFRKWLNTPTGARYYNGDADFDGDVDNSDLLVFWSHFGFERQPLAAASSSLVAAVPEPGSLSLLFLACTLAAGQRRMTRSRK